MRALQRTLRVLASIPVVTGLLVVVAGTAVIPGGETTSASVASELRFFASFWVGFGLVLWWLAPRLPAHGPLLRGACGVLFLGGVARSLSWADEGRPEPLFVVLTAIELVLPLVLVAWHARVARSHDDEGPR